MAYIKVPLTYHALPKVIKYVQLSDDQMAVLPIQAAILAAKESPRLGRLVIPSATALERKLGWDGADGRGIDALIRSGMMDKVDEGYVFLGWDSGWQNEQGHIIKNKEKARKAARALWRGVSVDAPSIA